MRTPDQIIGDNYLSRWHVLPRNNFFNIYLHKFTGSDDDRALHDHPYHSLSFLLKGRMYEVTDGGETTYGRRVYRYSLVRRFWPKFRRASMAHRMVLHIGPAWTLFITGPRFRQWGFICPQGWRHWKEFTSSDGLGVGRGCD